MESVSPKPIVLVIDPDPLNMTAIAAALHLTGYEAHCARDGEAAIKAARDLSLDLVICEVNLEKTSGVDLCKKIKSLSHNRDVPLMYLSAWQIPDVIRRAESTDGVYCLRKPFEPQILLDLVEHALWMPHLVNNRLKLQPQESAIKGPINRGAGAAERPVSI